MSNTAPPDPEQLLRLARAGNGPALGQLLERYRNYLALLARLRIGPRLRGKADASDMIQEAFLEAHRNFAQFRGTGEGEFLGWLRQILASRLGELIRRYLKTRRRDVRRERALGPESGRSSRVSDPSLVAPHSSPSQQAARREQAVRLADALGRLPEDYREVILLHHMEGLPVPQVARRLGRSVPSVEKLWARALARLSRTLGGPP
jgi:RNA polymerase sigma-70 factor (ECF subfamily)